MLHAGAKLVYIARVDSDSRVCDCEQAFPKLHHCQDGSSGLWVQRYMQGLCQRLDASFGLQEHGIGRRGGRGHDVGTSHVFQCRRSDLRLQDADDEHELAHGAINQDGAGVYGASTSFIFLGLGFIFLDLSIEVSLGGVDEVLEA